MTHKSLLLYLSFILFTTVSHQVEATTTEDTQNSEAPEALSVIQAQEQPVQGPTHAQEPEATPEQEPATTLEQDNQPYMNLAASQLDALASDTDSDTITSPAITTTTEAPLEEASAVVDSRETPITTTTTTPRSTTLQPVQNALQTFLQETRHYRTLMALTQDVHIKSCTIPLTLLHRIEADASCAICREEFAVHPEDQTEAFITLSNAQNEARCCSHMFHTACLKNWFESQKAGGTDLSCPTCRSTESFRQPLHNYRVVADEPAGLVTAHLTLAQAAVRNLVNEISNNMRILLRDRGQAFLFHYGINLSFITIHEALKQYLSLSISPAEMVLLTTFLPLLILLRSIDLVNDNLQISNNSDSLFLMVIAAIILGSMIPPIIQVAVPQVLLQGRITPFSFQGSLIGTAILGLPCMIESFQGIIAALNRPQAQALRRNFSTLSIARAAISDVTERIGIRAQQGAGFVRDASVTAAQSLYNLAQRGLGRLSTQAQQRAASLWGRVSNGVNSVFRRFAPAGNTVQAATANEPAIELDLENA